MQANELLSLLGGVPSDNGLDKLLQTEWSKKCQNIVESVSCDSPPTSLHLLMVYLAQSPLPSNMETRLPSTRSPALQALGRLDFVNNRRRAIVRPGLNLFSPALIPVLCLGWAFIPSLRYNGSSRCLQDCQAARRSCQSSSNEVQD
jgi:hypothetical protein